MFITWDTNINGDSCKIYWRKGKNGNVYIENVEYFNRKEVKKVNKEIDFSKIKYFEVKVVKVKKEKYPKECKHLEILFKDGIFQCVNCGHRLKIKRYDKNTRWGFIEFNQKQPKGNWVNGENLDKIMFPCFCSYIFGNHKFYGEIDKNWDDLAYDWVYQISMRNQQTKQLSVVLSCSSLEDMFINHKVKILKGKIVIFEEEEEK